MCGPNALVFREKLEVGGSLQTVGHMPGDAIHGKSLSQPFLTVLMHFLCYLMYI